VKFIHAPDYLPGPAFWAAALRSSTVVLLSGAQYVRQSRHNRARVRTPDGVQWLTIPVRRGQLGHSIARTELMPGSQWRRIHRKALRYNYGRTPFYEHYVDELEDAMPEAPRTVADVTVPLVRLLADWLGCEADILEESGTTSGDPDRRGYCLEGPDGKVFCVACEVAPYRQAFPGFEPGLSAMDLLFNHGPSSRDRILSGSRVLDNQLV
jgi:WbqC-like protein